MDFLNFIASKGMSNTEKSFKLTSFSKTFTKACFGMIVNGVFPCYSSRVVKSWLVTNVVLQVTGILILINAAIKDIEIGDYTDATRQLSILFLTIIMVIKMYCLVRHKKTYLDMINRIDTDYKFANEHLPDEDAEIIRSYAKLGLLVQNIWAFLVFVVGSVFISSAIAIILYSFFTDVVIRRQMVFYTILPVWDEYKYDTPIFQTFFVYEAFFNTSNTFLYIGFDPLVPIFSLHLCGQLDLVKARLMKVFDNEQIYSKQESKIKLSKIIEDLQVIYRYADEFSESGRSVYEAVFSFTPILSTVAAYQTFSMLKNDEIPYEFAMFFVATIVHIFIPSYFGDLLLEKSLSMGDAVYCCRWEGAPDLEARSTLVLMLMRSQKPLQLSTLFKPVCLQLFSEVCQQSWTFFNLLRVFFDKN